VKLAHHAEPLAIDAHIGGTPGVKTRVTTLCVAGRDPKRGEQRIDNAFDVEEVEGAVALRPVSRRSRSHHNYANVAALVR